jgi:hypothetical protein
MSETNRIKYKQKLNFDMYIEQVVPPKFEISANRLEIISYGGQAAISQEEIRNDFGMISERK